MIKNFDEYIKESYNNLGFVKSRSNYYLINESQESKSQSEAIKLVMDTWGWDKTKETMFQLKTDYPGVTFNSGKAIVATNGKQYDKEARRRNGIGISIGPSVGYYYFFPTQSFKPAVGISVTIGYTFTPKAFQW
jgi:hypothetical protein